MLDPTTPVIVATGHGAFFDDSGARIELTEEVALSTQKHLLRKWAKALGETEKIARSDLGRSAQLTENDGELEHLLGIARISAASASAVDRSIFRNLRRFASGPQTRRQALTTDLVGEDYIEQCRTLGVPVPSTVSIVDGNNWTLHESADDDIIDTNFIGGDARLLTWESSDPPGGCSVLRRDDSGGIFAIGLICMGTSTNRACFFDFKREFQGSPSGNLMDIEEFLGGADLAVGGDEADVCSDCHAGADPWVRHPDDIEFNVFENSASFEPGSWYEPVVPDDWPQNPGPMLPPPVPPGAADCGECHHIGGQGGAFPLITAGLQGYCTSILGRVGGPGSFNTMPPYGKDYAPYELSHGLLESMCDLPAHAGPGGQTVTAGSHQDDPGFVSPPILQHPIYECAESVIVTGVRLGATVVVYFDGNAVGWGVVRDPGGTEIGIPRIDEGDTVTVTARATFAGYPSDDSNEVEVRSYLVDHPNGMPAPRISPTLVHECGGRVGVSEKIPGSSVIVYTEDPAGNLSTTAHMPSAQKTTVAWGDGPFVVDTELYATQELCGDESPPSNTVVASPAPVNSGSGSVRVDPPEIYEGQSLFNFSNILESSTVTVSDGAGNLLDDLVTWPRNFYPRWDYEAYAGQPLGVGDEFQVSQQLCRTGTTATRSLTVTRTCSDIPAPEVTPLRDGQDYLDVMNHIPGANVRVYDGSSDEIGDGGHRRILLSRPVAAGEVLQVSQSLGPNCDGNKITSVAVAPGDGVRIKEWQ